MQTASGKVPITGAIVASEVLVASAAPTLLIDCTGVKRGEGIAALANLGPNTIFISFNNDAGNAPALTTATGVPITANFFVVLDNIGGMAVWAICSVLQIAGAGTRVTGGKVT